MSEVKSIIVKETPIVLDKERNLRFDLNTFANLEDIYGSIDEAMKKMEQGSVKAIRAILWSALVHEDPALTQKAVGAMLAITDLNEIAGTLTEAITGSQIIEKDKKAVEKTVKNPLA